ncbi:hypothetical protein ACFQ60_41335 [Streptomyces zhihengii]
MVQRLLQQCHRLAVVGGDEGAAAGEPGAFPARRGVGRPLLQEGEGATGGRFVTGGGRGLDPVGGGAPGNHGAPAPGPAAASAVRRRCARSKRPRPRSSMPRA